MEDSMKKYSTYLEDKKIESVKLQKELIEDERSDEANLEKVRYNIYDVFSQLLQSAMKRNSDMEQMKKTYVNYFDTIPASWKVRLEKAKEHNDVETAYVEEIKLGIANELKTVFLEFCE